jgi:hypothetical protein
MKVLFLQCTNFDDISYELKYKHVLQKQDDFLR